MRRLEPRPGGKKAIVALARKLLVAVWHLLTEEVADRYAVDLKVACAFFAFAYRVGVRNPSGVDGVAGLGHVHSFLVLARESDGSGTWSVGTVTCPTGDLAHVFCRWCGGGDGCAIGLWPSGSLQRGRRTWRTDAWLHLTHPHRPGEPG